MPDKHISSQFDLELNALCSNLLEMGGLVESQTQEAMAAFTEMDLARCEAVIAREKLVNAKEIEIDSGCTEIIAKRQPTARDLRLVMAIIKANTNLERAGDEAEKVAKRTRRIIRKGVENNINFFVSLLEDYAQRERRFKERKSIPLPHGKIATREGRQSWDVNHDDFLPWARINRPDLMRVVEEPKLKEMKALLEVVGDRVVDPTSGEVVAGVVITQAEMSITITTNKGE